MIRVKIQKTINLKNGTTIEAGTSVLCGPHATHNSLCIITLDNISKYTVTYSSIFKVPGLKTLEKYCFDAIAKTPIGKRVEPDGHDEYGFPSWPLICGVI